MGTRAGARQIAWACLAGLGACAFGPSGPAPLSSADDQAVQEVLAHSPQARAELEEDCLRGTAGSTPAKERAAMAELLGVGPAEVPRVFCQRLVAAIARGDLSHADYEALQSGSEDPAFMRRLARILRRPPGGYAI